MKQHLLASLDVPLLLADLKPVPLAPLPRLKSPPLLAKLQLQSRRLPIKTCLLSGPKFLLSRQRRKKGRSRWEISQRQGDITEG
jgi:hypothetical protein